MTSSSCARSVLRGRRFSRFSGSSDAATRSIFPKCLFSAAVSRTSCSPPIMPPLTAMRLKRHIPFSMRNTRARFSLKCLQYGFREIRRIFQGRRRSGNPSVSLCRRVCGASSTAEPFAAIPRHCFCQSLKASMKSCASSPIRARSDIFRHLPNPIRAVLR